MPKKSNGRVLLGHGGGGKMTGRLIRDVILPRLDRGALGPLPDSVVLNGLGSSIAYTTDSFVVSPLFFPGGNIGSLSVHGTCNDLACSGARPLFLSLGLILEEGFPLEQLDSIVTSIAAAADDAGVQIVTGDTKVVPKGSADGIFINTSGIGKLETDIRLSPSCIVEGDEIIVSGPVGNHGMAVMLSRAEFSFDFDLKSDSASIWPLAERLLELGDGLKFLRDPTRGGIAATLNEIAASTGKGVRVTETAIPVDESVAAAAEILGIDPFQAANEGKIVAVVGKGLGSKALELLGDSPLARDAAVIGEITTTNPSKVVMITRIGGSRIMAEPSGELLPRIC
ncbi:hydrogenase expression/formation protein HypE [Desulfomonile tiedjei]|uniref:Hydrogenase maturation protein, carbamoyl dehydratase HypE n=1 Tax=Desulfomonile tiedjei (strain ATCC 49306 / DSM 6799 / DCB-1) TaxID=706587 RepID=I4CB03_DESTA|nr:hydrogenase expression/formation protein HypE [Desulfomonile tiedjei]AFM26744.1 Hydrogenase maturation protein, carbamoyl dehydratase HypE [Desulfomonile tiedjei DSM 6799]